MSEIRFSRIDKIEVTISTVGSGSYLAWIADFYNSEEDETCFIFFDSEDEAIHTALHIDLDDELLDWAESDA